MAAVDRWHIWKAGTEMSLPDHLGRLPARSKKVPVRVKLERINCDVGKLHPPDGDRQTWIDRLKAALGTASIEFVDATLYQLQAAARLPNSGVSEIGVNAALAFIEGERPRSETECAIVVQMAWRAFGGDGRPRSSRWWTRWRSSRFGSGNGGKPTVAYFRNLG